MKSTGIVRTVDSVGRMVLPAEIREKFGIKEGGELEIFVDSNSNLSSKKKTAGRRFSENVICCLSFRHPRHFFCHG